MKKKLWIVANWKAKAGFKEALNWIDTIGPKLVLDPDLKIVICPDFVELEEVKKSILVGNFPLMVGSQDLSPFPVGAYTGEEPAQFLQGIVELSIIGHSERRQNFHETDQQVQQKVQQALAANIIPLVCVQDINTPVPPGCQLVAYEPIFAIGSGHPDSPESAETVAQALKQKYGPELEVLYGGSVTSQNVKQFVGQDHIDGVLVGTASLDPDEFWQIIIQARSW